MKADVFMRYAYLFKHIVYYYDDMYDKVLVRVLYHIFKLFYSKIIRSLSQ